MSQESVKQALLAKIQAVQENPAQARLVFRASTALVEDVKCTAQVRDFAPLTIDEPPDLGGSDTGVNPVELVLVALGTCQEIMYSAYAAVMGVKLDEVKIDVKGYLDVRGLLSMDESVPAGYEKIVYDTQIKSSADPESIQKVIAMAESHCPLLDMMQRPVEITGEVKLNGKRLETTAEAAA
ncbi:OsmC family protein [Methyloceanibacter sp. wino2]|uniref:OsmC family protein n=1 Tax=Methyloceanibacter sp. wino2 TaxID=2170729 RepID=UPI000D3E1081|nr:OsmC family protein [Methyloceanibacter sp. wino2]